MNMVKRLVYRFALWLESKAYDLQYWAEPPVLNEMDFNSLVVGGINRDPSPLWRSNALADRLRNDTN